MYQAAELLASGDAEGAAALYKRMYSALSAGVSGGETKTRDPETLKQQATCLLGEANNEKSHRANFKLTIG